ncbi:DUF2325 domain-containing protein [Methylibium petroleiphilum]|uniref:DUF2325 domain-containing protein n=1 Tax=Methylibium petroleiphilum TaxID=105560 RepID=UPI001AC2F105|nr:DUF2325 domain-containing protein [Methylibium petroleiphilum]MBN9203765.1 DUF2325 domain-containing protein [Methylibium petroleiphilum]
MCKPDPLQLDALVAAAEPPARRPPPQSSRRRRLWELDGHAHCPVLGVCLPMHVLRRLLTKALRSEAQADDYELHCGAVTECKARTRVAEAVQRELDQRYALAVRQAARAKTPEALAAWWDEALRGQDIAGPLWAALTHPRCTPALACRIEGQVHMLQHQAGMAARVDLDRFEALLLENAVLSRELGGAQQRSMRQVADHARRAEELQAQIVSLRAQLIVRDTAIAGLREDLQALETAVPGLESRFELVRANQRLIERVHQAERTQLQSLHEVERLRRHADELATELQRRPAHRPGAVAGEGDSSAEEPVARLDDQAVLCVGGRPASVPVYRQLIERTGGRFLHHDGGDEDSVAKLDATLAAADLVICQTGCVSHDAYWRVKDHCKRTGKRCVFVESPSGAGLKRALLTLVPVSIDHVAKSS